MSWQLPPNQRSYLVRGEHVKSLRMNRGWTQEQFAAVVGYTPRLISKAERSASLNPETIEHIAEALTQPEDPVYPEDLVSNPQGSVKTFLESYDQHGPNLLQYCGHVFAEDVVFWCAGAEDQIPFAGTYHGLDGFKEFFQRFFAIVTRPQLEPIKPHYSVAGNEVIAKYEEVTCVNGVIGGTIWVINISKFERGKIVRMENYFDTHTGQSEISKNAPDGV